MFGMRVREGRGEHRASGVNLLTADAITKVSVASSPLRGRSGLCFADLESNSRKVHHYRTGPRICAPQSNLMRPRNDEFAQDGVDAIVDRRYRDRRTEAERMGIEKIFRTHRQRTGCRRELDRRAALEQVRGTVTDGSNSLEPA